MQTKTHISVIITLAAIITACTGGGKMQWQATSDSAKAKLIADTLWHPYKLDSLAQHYNAAKDIESELLIRQKLGTVMRNRSDFEAAVKQHDRCIELATMHDDTLQLIIAYNNQGTNFRRIGDLQQASTNHYKALELCDKITGDTSFIARKNIVRTLNGLGNVMLSLGNDEVAEEMFRRALRGEQELRSATGQAINYANIGAIKERNGDVDSARIYYNLSMQKNIEANNKIGISLCFQNLGELDEAAGNYKAARENYLKSYEMGLRTKDVWHWLNPCTALAQLNIKEGNHKEALRYNSEALEAAKRIGAKGRLASLYAQQAVLYEAKGQWREALESTHTAQAYSDSAAIEENRIHTQNLRVNYEINKRKEEVEKALAKAEYEKEIRNTILWGSCGIILFAIIAIMAIVRAARQRRITNEALKKIDRERQEFYRGITHQLRTPLTVVLGMTHELERFIPSDNALAQKEFDAVTRKSKELLALITEMIEYNRGERDKININEFPKNESAPTSKDNTLINNNLQTWRGDLHEYVLLAEDDNDVALLITQMLKNEGYSYCWAQNGKEALEIIEQKHPQLVITDIMMPQMDGIELIKALRGNEETNHIPIIVVSARTENNDRLAGLDAGAEVYLGKPFIPDELLMMVRKLIEQREMLKKKYSKQILEANIDDYNGRINGIKKSDKEFIRQIDEYIHENIMDCNLNAAMLAEHMIMSITTLNRKINSVTGTNTTNYIRQRRLARAKY
ncbi:MAG: response regulator, partial [Bacteroidaceae bacterium]|nr:response regulator [Bacteroidaceae bacterium]